MFLLKNEFPDVEVSYKSHPSCGPANRFIRMPTPPSAAKLPPSQPEVETHLLLFSQQKKKKKKEAVL